MMQEAYTIVTALFYRSLTILISIALTCLVAPLSVASEPSLPAGLSLEEEDRGKDALPAAMETSLPFDLSGFWELRAGMRTQNDPHEKDMSIGETRLQFEMEKNWENATIRVTSDLVYDPVLDEHDVNIERGEGFFDLREASLLLRPADFMDIKVGRQVLTWGTGDLLFINDLFPKDWNSFFIGRDDENLKAPADTVRLSFFAEVANLDVVYAPRFDADHFIDGRRISYYNSTLDSRSGSDTTLHIDRPDDCFEDYELHLRLYRNLRGYELNIYGYRGFWKSPAGMDLATERATFPELSVYGGSLRGQLLKGIAHIELGYYDSEEDRDGDDHLVRNGEFRFLVGYEQEISRDFTAGLQYYLENMLDYHDYKHTLPASVPRKDKNRQVITLRLTRLLMNQNLTLSFFAYYSPTDDDAYLRPKVNYKIDDRWTAEIGGNVFLGEEDYTFFGQFEKNNNIYMGLRYGF